MIRADAKIAPLLFGSGFCALVYQIAWTRELRLIFGASTAASAAVLAIFMGGLGLGSLLLGKRADRHGRPLELYAHLEFGIAATAALSPLLVWLTRTAYIAVGGASALGQGGATVARLALSALVLAVPTVLMGGTLPAAARAASTAGDVGRRSLALLYGVNTFGAVAGALATNFLLLEVFGTRLTLWLACLLNALVAVFARMVARSLAARESAEAPTSAMPQTREAKEIPAPVAPAFVLSASGIAGSAFLLMELVWYRMLAPLLGGSSYTFGLILAVALFGIGVGGALYARRPEARAPTLAGFALTCALEAFFLALPLWLGDRVAILALLLRPLGGVGFIGHVAGWIVVTSVVVLPAAIVSGYQFPLLIGLLGHGKRDVGRHVGLAYATNTLGAIVGSLAGGFGLLPLLTAPGAWRVATGVLLALGIASMALSFLGERRPGRLAAPAVIAALGALMLRAEGPTAAWRHSPIGAGRVDLMAASGSRNEIIDWARKQRREIGWQADGVESSVALSARNGLSFLVNGKSDGNALSDAGTQVLGGLIGSFLHPNPKRALVVGLGTGSTAGWLGAVPSIERVDVVEFEPAIIHVARACAAVNHGALENPKVKVHLGDAREVVLTARDRYDVLFSEPSNPYRAGISSLFTREFYEAARGALAEGGLFLQWLQAYEVDASTVRTALATVGAVFPSVEIWQSDRGDFILVAGQEPRPIDVAALRKRAEEEPYRRALRQVWRVDDLEGVLAHHVARPELVRRVAREEGGVVNTDDRNLFEFAIARTLGKGLPFDALEVSRDARRHDEDRPPVVNGEVDWALVDDHRVTMMAAEVGRVETRPPATPQAAARREAVVRFAGGDLRGALVAWPAEAREPRSNFERLALAEGLAEAADEQALAEAEPLRELQPCEVAAIRARLRLRQGRRGEAADALEEAYACMRSHPWTFPATGSRSLKMAREVAGEDRSLMERMLAALDTPFAVSALEHERNQARVSLGFGAAFREHCARVLAPLEPHVPWQQRLLFRRADCYRMTSHPLAGIAEKELARFMEGTSQPFAVELEPPAGTPEAEHQEGGDMAPSRPASEKSKPAP